MEMEVTHRRLRSTFRCISYHTRLITYNQDLI
uniref:Uncharacterized protein n=1 Tax=Heterorhabditis bacteriophora TaxID=37862 RepID=A0A1I7WDQ6_HETBA